MTLRAELEQKLGELEDEAAPQSRRKAPSAIRRPSAA
jgi:hypothetical protein